MIYGIRGGGKLSLVHSLSKTVNGSGPACDVIVCISQVRNNDS